MKQGFDAAACALTRLIRRQEAQDLLEYGLLAALIAIVAVGAVSAVGNKIHTVLWEYIVSSNV